MNRKAVLTLVILLSAVVLFSGCASNEGGDTEANVAVSTAATEDTTPASQPPSEAAPEPSTEPSDTAATEPGTAPEDRVTEPGAAEAVTPPSVESAPPEDLFLGASNALEALDSYSYTTSFTFVGEEDGEVHTGSIELAATVVGSDQMRLEWRDLEEGSYVAVIRIEDEAWISDNGEWESVPVYVADAMSQAVLVFAPSVVWDGLFGAFDTVATYVGPESVNGVPTQHYTSTVENWGTYWAGQLSDAAGDLWIADAGYPAKYYFTASGIDQDGSSGTVTWSMEVYDVNKPTQISPPEVLTTY